jgi:hypothetical protein
MIRTMLRGTCLAAAAAAAALAVPASAGATLDLDGATVEAAFLTKTTGVLSVSSVQCEEGHAFDISVQVRKGKKLIAEGASSGPEWCNSRGFADVVVLAKGKLKDGTVYQTTITVTEYDDPVTQSVVDVSDQLSGPIAWRVAT